MRADMTSMAGGTCPECGRGSYDHEPAFPQSETLYEDGAMLSREQHGGMYLRDWFAGQALAGMLSNPGRVGDFARRDSLTSEAYHWADAMLSEREPS